MIILATLRGEFEDQPGEIGNFARRFWKIAGKVGNFTREIWKSRRSSTERVDTDLRMCRPGRVRKGVHLRGGGPGLPIKASELRVLEGTYENKIEGFGSAIPGPVD